LQRFCGQNLEPEALETLAFSRWWALREPEFERNTPLNEDIVRASKSTVKALLRAERALKHLRDVEQRRLETSRTNSTEGRTGAESMLFRTACDEFKKLSPYNHGLEFLEFQIRDACEAFRQAPSSLVGEAQRGRDREHEHTHPEALLREEVGVSRELEQTLRQEAVLVVRGQVRNAGCLVVLGLLDARGGRHSGSSGHAKRLNDARPRKLIS
jgi:hypothetical protein